MNSAQTGESTERREGQETERQTSKNITEIVAYAPNIRFFGEIAVAFIIFFQILYIQLEYDFPLSVSLVPLALYSCFQLRKNLSLYISADVDAERHPHAQALINWIAISVYQVRCHN